MRRTWRKIKPKLQKRFQINEFIRAPEVFLINEEGVQIGNISLSLALQKAREAELDLVEVNPKAVPPIVKIMDFGQFKYEKEKKEHKQKLQQKKLETKGIRLSIRISSHDLDVRIDQAKKFLSKGHKLKIEIVLKGRERQYPQKAMEIINHFVQKLESSEELSVVKEQNLTKQGNRYTILLGNKK